LRWFEGKLKPETMLFPIKDGAFWWTFSRLWSNGCLPDLIPWWDFPSTHGAFWQLVGATSLRPHWNDGECMG
jgi:hypothetical protein